MDLQARIRLRWNGEHHRDHGGPHPLQRGGARAAPLREQGAEEEGDRRSSSADCYNQLGNEATVTFLDELKDIGFRYATLSGPLASASTTCTSRRRRSELIEQARRQVVNEVEQQYQDGVITNGERYNKVVDIWAHVTEQIADEMFKELEVRASRAASSTPSS